MNGAETSIVVLSDSESDSDSDSKCARVVTIDESNAAESEIEVITLDDSNVSKSNVSSVSFKLDTTPDFIPINRNILYPKPRRSLRRRRLNSSPEISVLKMSKCVTEDMISFAAKSIKACRKKTKQKGPKKFNETKPKKTNAESSTEKSNVESSSTEKSNVVSSTKSEDCDTRKPRIPQIHLSHTNIHDTAKTARPFEGLRPIIIDGCNVSFGFGNGEFQIEGIISVVQYFQKRGHDEIVTFLPQYYRNKFRPTNITKIIRQYEKENIIVYTPSRFLNGKLIKPYDDRFIVQYASERGGVIISNDGYADLINEEPSWRITIEQRIINFTFARKLLMLPKDPLGPSGPTLDEMLKFPDPV